MTFTEELRNCLVYAPTMGISYAAIMMGVVLLTRIRHLLSADTDATEEDSHAY